MQKDNVWHTVPVGNNAPQKVNAIIEISKDSQVKYELDKETGMLKLDRFLYSAAHYPGDYGFIPQTLWDDGDPLDVIILTGKPVLPMTLVEIRVIGVLRMIDDDEEDDKILAVYAGDPRYKEVESVQDVPTHTIIELKNFFERYKELQGKEVTIPEILGKTEAYKAIEKSQKMYRMKYDLIALEQANIATH